VVAGAHGDDAAPALGLRQQEQLVQCAALLERGGELQVLELQPQLAAGVAPEAVSEAQRLLGAAPLRLAAAMQDSDLNVFNKLESDLIAVCQDRLEPQTVAQAWVKGDVALALSWLRRRLHEELRARAAAGAGSTEVTVPAGATLHNAWQTVPARALFEQYDRAEKLQNLLGSGLNIELAVQAMLSALVVNRGRP
jgi:hypothetical protein